MAIEHRALVIGAIFAGVAFLEATINELFSDMSEQPQNSRHVKEIPQDAQRLMGSLWKFDNFARRGLTLEKFQAALLLAGKPRLEPGLNPYQAVQYLIELRNALVHYYPEWILINTGKTKQSELHKLEKHLRGKFSTNPLIPHLKPFFPHQCLGHGCAEWATKNSTAFVSEFYKNLGITDSLKQIGDKLKTR